MHALDAVYGAGRTAPLLVGSIKTNIGHAEAAAGIAGLLKVVASLELGRLPRHLHFETLNPQIRISPDRIAASAMEAEWRPVGGHRAPRVSAVSATGANVHRHIEGRAAPDPVSLG